MGASAFAMFAAIGATSVASAQGADEEQIETVTVTGFRASLERALDMKRNALDSSDSIMAEDIAKFPDMNVSESLQRIPGVAITRESGEGRQVTVRGLSADFTRVRINGIEAMATAGSQDVSTSGGGTNRGRAFDFNIFASDLFSQLTVHKSASASLEEGSLGATVDLRTAHPFDHSGFVFTMAAQEGYQMLAKSGAPRISMLVSNTFMGGRFGVLLSASYGTTNTLEEGTSSVRWVSNINTSTSASVSSSYNFGSVCTDAGSTCYTSGDTFSEANSAFRPRFPRYDIVKTNSKRLGLTGSVQWQPDDETLFTLDALFADYYQVRNEYYLEANSFSTSGSTTQGSYTDSDSGETMYYTSTGVKYMQLINYSSSNLSSKTGRNSVGGTTYTLDRAEVVGVGLRNEHRLDHLDTRFMQVTLDGSHTFSEAFKVHALAGWTESHHRNPVQATLAADYGCYGDTSATTGCGAGTTDNPYVYDYTYGNMPLLSTGNVDPTSTSGWFLSNIRMREEYVYNSFRSAQADFEYKPMDQFTLSGGFDYRNYGYRTLEMRRSNGDATSTSEATTISDDVRSIALSSYTSQIAMRGIDIPSGSNTSWFTFDFKKASDLLNIWDRDAYPVTKGPGYSSTGTVNEADYGAWVQAGWDVDVMEMPLRGDVGVRYVLTEASSLGYALLSGDLDGVKGHHVYHDFLPSLNAVLNVTDDFLVRFNASYVMSRPGLSSMMPTGKVTVSGSNATASVGNPMLNPTRAKNLDLSFEWYYDKGSMLSVAGFWKHIDTFVQSVQTSGTAAENPFGLSTEAFVSACGGSGSDWSTITTSYCVQNGGEDMTWTYTYSKNAKGAPLYGTEINWQQQFNFMPHPFDNFGYTVNYTYVQAQQKYYNSDGTLIMKEDLLNLSRNSYNFTVYYDDQVFQARVTGAFRSHYLFNNNIASNNNNYGIYSDSTFNLDMSASYKYNESLMFTFDAMNLTNQASNIYADKYAKRAYQYHETGTNLYLGVKYTY